jgi:hypothetical protein
MNLASVLVNSVLPTPVGPRNMNEPIGRLGSFKPARARRTAREMAMMASSCPMMPLRSSSSILSRRCDSASASCMSGTPVHMETTSAISSAETTGLLARSQPVRRRSICWRGQSRALPIRAYLRCCLLLAQGSGSDAPAQLTEQDPWLVSRQGFCTCARAKMIHRSGRLLCRVGIFR